MPSTVLAYVGSLSLVGVYQRNGRVSIRSSLREKLAAQDETRIVYSGTEEAQEPYIPR